VVGVCCEGWSERCLQRTKTAAWTHEISNTRGYGGMERHKTTKWWNDSIRGGVFE